MIVLKDGNSIIFKVYFLKTDGELRGHRTFSKIVSHNTHWCAGK